MTHQKVISNLTASVDFVADSAGTDVKPCLALTVTLTSDQYRNLILCQQQRTNWLFNQVLDLYVMNMSPRTVYRRNYGTRTSG